MSLPRRRIAQATNRAFSSTCRCSLVRHVSELPDRIVPRYLEVNGSDVLGLQWPAAPRNVLLVKKSHSVAAKSALLEFGEHITSTYPKMSLLAEPALAQELHNSFSVPLFSTSKSRATSLQAKTDLIATFGGDGTILQASGLFASLPSVPPILSFSMGTLGFLGEWQFSDYQKAFRQVYRSRASSFGPDRTGGPPGSRVLLRHRLKVGIYDGEGRRLALQDAGSYHALNEVLLHRGSEPQLIRVVVLVNGEVLTEGVADGMLISTPTGSTAYALSAGGSIIHPMVQSLLITPVCPRSLSFRPLVLPNSVEVVLKLSEGNRAKHIEVAVDGIRRVEGLSSGTEVRVTGETVYKGPNGWSGGVPCLMGGDSKTNDDGWVGGLNSLLKFNYPFGEKVDI